MLRRPQTPRGNRDAKADMVGRALLSLRHHVDAEPPYDLALRVAALVDEEPAGRRCRGHSQDLVEPNGIERRHVAAVPVGVLVGRVRGGKPAPELPRLARIHLDFIAAVLRIPDKAVVHELQLRRLDVGRLLCVDLGLRLVVSWKRLGLDESEAIDLRTSLRKLAAGVLQDAVDFVARKFGILLQVESDDSRYHRRGEGRAAVHAGRAGARGEYRHVLPERAEVLGPVVVESGGLKRARDAADVDDALHVLRKGQRLVRGVSACRDEDEPVVVDHRPNLLPRPFELRLSVVERRVSAAEVHDFAAVREAPPEAVDVVDESSSLVGVERTLGRNAEGVGGDDSLDAGSVRRARRNAMHRRAFEVRVRAGNDVANPRIDHADFYAAPRDAGVEEVHDAKLAEIPRLRGIVGRDV